VLLAKRQIKNKDQKPLMVLTFSLNIDIVGHTKSSGKTRPVQKKQHLKKRSAKQRKLKQQIGRSESEL
jgi:hypothetical protein